MLKTKHPEIEKVHLHQDNARCYHSASTVLACPSIEASTGVKVEGLDFRTLREVKVQRIEWKQ